MPDTLSLSRAARCAGVSRDELQQRIESGEITSFEGAVHREDLLRVYPHAALEDHAEFDRVEGIKAAAINKRLPDDSPSAFERLRQERAVLQRQLVAARDDAARYRGVVEELSVRLEDIHARCDERQRVMLRAVITWMMHQLGRDSR